MNGVILIIAVFLGVLVLVNLDRSKPTWLACIAGGATAAVVTIVLQQIGALL